MPLNQTLLCQLCEIKNVHWRSFKAYYLKKISTFILKCRQQSVISAGCIKTTALFYANYF